jgi:hypothetical protein
MIDTGYNKERPEIEAFFLFDSVYARFFFVPVSRLCFSTSIRSLTVAVAFLGSAK